MFRCMPFPVGGPIGRNGAVNPIPALEPAAWFRFNTGITVVGAGVDTWADQSGNSRDLRQTTDTNRPTKEADGAITFDGSDNYLATAGFTLNQPTTIYLLGKQITWTAGDRVFDGNAGNSGGFLQNDDGGYVGASPYVQAYAGSYLRSSATGLDAWTLNTYAVICIVFNGASSLIQINAGSALTGNAGAANMGGLKLGAAGGVSQFSNIQTKEMILFPVAHDVATRAIVRAYLNGVGGL
jgi:hypothetical protein